MNLDIRMPIGLLFSLIGTLLLAYGLLAGPTPGAATRTFNINAWWGALLIVFGASMLLLWWRQKRRAGRLSG